MPTLPALQKTFRRALTAALAASPVVSGCGPDPGIEKDPDFVPARCSQETNEWLPDLMLEPAVDYLELKSFGEVREALGVPCKTAAMVEACQAKLRDLSMSGGLTLFTAVDHAEQSNLNVTRGDQVFAVGSIDALLALLGTIDTPAEAMLVSQISGYNVLCDGGGARPSTDGFEVQAYRYFGCGGLTRYLISVQSNGTLKVVDHAQLKDAQRGCVVGRRPAGLCAPTPGRSSRAGEYLARAATLEAASVEAFRRLAAELAAHGAPRSLIGAAQSAAADEVRHARVTARLARRWGAQAERPRIRALPLRGLEQIAHENAHEGCVRETFGALEGRWMAMRAADARVRRVYRTIAEDELRHAALSWRVARFLEPRLGHGAQRRMRDVRHAALSELERALAEEPSAEVHRLCGVPNANEARVLFAELRSALA